MSDSFVTSQRNEIQKTASTVSLPMTSSQAMNSKKAEYNHYEFKRSRSQSPDKADHILDFSYMDLSDINSEDENQGIEVDELFQSSNKNISPKNVSKIFLNNNLLKSLPHQLMNYDNLQTLDLSFNQLDSIFTNEAFFFNNLKVLIAKSNNLDDYSLPKDLHQRLPSLEIVNFGGNLFKEFPYQILAMASLIDINLGSNKIQNLPRDFSSLQALQVLYLGGNQIKVVPNELCQLESLTTLNLSFNLINKFPNNLKNLKNLKMLALHNNNLKTLPIELVRLNLKELSLRNNPLVNRFAKEYSYNVPSLLELSARTIKMKDVHYCQKNLPQQLISYLNSARCCLNPMCAGVYFQSKVECIKFVDFCGKYRIPFMQYLCSSTCNEQLSASSDHDLLSDETCNNEKLKKIYVG
jgi:Leucine-rich repeat (LRR) protein